MEIAVSSEYYMCSSCNVTFNSQAEYKAHYGTKFHQYNVKRKLIDLPPATLEQYTARFNQFSEEKTVTKQAKNKQAKNFCNVCSKSFGNQNTFESHLKSKKHLETLKKKEMQQEQAKENQTQKPVQKSMLTTLDDVSICLFSDFKSENLEQNLIYMEKNFGFFIIEKKYCTNIPGLLKYLAEKINIGMLCIYCENKGTKDFKSGEAVKAHMIDKGHCFMSKKTFDEYAEFYDFSENKDHIEEEEEVEEVEEEVEVEKIQEEDNGDEEEGEWEDEDDDEWDDEEEDEDESCSEMDEEQKKINEKNKKAELAQKRKQFRQQYRKLNKQRFAKFEFNDNGELELENGKIFGHRDYKRQYKMYYRNLADPFRNIKSILGPEHAQQRQIMLSQRSTQIALFNKHQRQVAFREEEKHIAKSIFREKKNHLRVGRNNNQTTMHHYKNQNPL